jgi:hypothetical protein
MKRSDGLLTLVPNVPIFQQTIEPNRTFSTNIDMSVVQFSISSPGGSAIVPHFPLLYKSFVFERNDL